MKTSLFPILLFLLAANAAKSQAPSADHNFVGTWRGTSICQIKNSPCHDEVVVYYITQAPGTDSFRVSASKIVNGKEDNMGVLGFKLDRTKNQFISTDFGGLWTFTLQEKKLDGTLVYNGKLFRIVKLTKQE